MDIVFNVNPLGLDGLGATLSSLVRNCSNTGALKLWFLCNEISETDKKNIESMLRFENFTGSTEMISFDAKKLFGHLRSLHGDWTTYGRLLIPQHVMSDRALYLDADLIISLDILEMRDIDFEEHLIAAVFGSTVSWTIEKQFFVEKLNCSPETAYFNAGILLLNLKKWRDSGIDALWKEIASKYPTEIISHDQTLLNALCRGEFKHLPQRFNNPWYPGKAQPEEASKSIIHFVGSPKPWDFMGRFIHAGFPFWNVYNTDFWSGQYRRLNRDRLVRAWKIRNSIARTLVKKLK